MNILFGNWYAVFVVDSLANLRLLDGLLVVYREESTIRCIYYAISVQTSESEVTVWQAKLV